MVQVLELSQLTPAERERLLRRAEKDIRDLLPLAQTVIDDVRTRGDAAVVEYARRFDAPGFDASMLRAAPADFEHARASLEPAVLTAIAAAHDHIRRFHEEQLPERMWFTQLGPGIMAGEKVSPIASAALYVPRGKGAFPSVMLMLATPALAAGVPRTIVLTPPTPEGRADAASLAAAQVCGIDEVYVVGGMQAIAAAAYGTETIPRVAKVVGPGSSYVSAAKRLLYGVVDVGLPAGPSEAIILADESADPRLAALDLLVEAEHGPDSAALLVTNSRELAAEAQGWIETFAAELPDWRRAFVTQVLNQYGGILLTDSVSESVDFVNAYAPEHLEVLTRDPWVTLQQIENAGEILLGPYTPIPLANYCLGLNAILPTGGFARSFSSVSVWDFLKRSGVGFVSPEGFQALSSTTTTLADYEGFPAHAQAIRQRNAILGL